MRLNPDKMIFRSLLLIVLCGLPSSLILGQYAPHGGIFTPKGTLRALVVFIRLKDAPQSNPNFNNAAQSLPQWDMQKNKGYPEFLDIETGRFPAFLYQENEDFERYQYDSTMDRSYSKFYYTMAQPKTSFKLMGESFTDSLGRAVVVEVDPTGCASWGQVNRRVVQAMAALHPDFEAHRFDQRHNRPNFRFDNSDTAKYGADGAIDYTVFVYRYSRSWAQQPVPGMARWSGSGGGFASLGGAQLEKPWRTHISDGFTMMSDYWIFIHELAHVLYNCPHLFSANHTVGEYWPKHSVGWGSMATIPLFRSLTAWERWYLGFIEPHTFHYADTLQEVVLTDFITTGAALRIALPFSEGQYLWLENHQQLSTLDRHPWAGKIIGKDTLQQPARGVYAYVEALTDSRDEILHPLSDKTNGLLLLHADGNYDYALTEDVPHYNAWGNPLQGFTRGAENPTTGTNPFFFYRGDLNGDGRIQHQKGYNSARNESSLGLAREWIHGRYQNTYQSFGSHDTKKLKGYSRGAAFRAGDALDLNSNPMPLNYPKYNMKTQTWAPLNLNGVAIRFLPMENGLDLRVQVRYDGLTLRQNRRWTGSIRVPNISRDARADLHLARRRRLKLTRTQTPQRHLPDSLGRFSQPTVLRVASGATLRLGRGAQLILEDDSRLVLERGARVILERRAQIVCGAAAQIVDEGAELVLQRGARMSK